MRKVTVTEENKTPLLFKASNNMQGLVTKGAELER